MVAKSKVYSNVELNYFRICHVTTNILPRALRTVLKQEWDSRYKALHGDSLSTSKNATDFYTGELKENQRKLDRHPLLVVKNGNVEEWHCTCLFFAILYSNSIGSKISYTVMTSVNNLREFRNKCFAHALGGRVLDKDFNASLQVAIDAFKVLGLCTSDIEAIKMEKIFPTLDLNTLKEQAKTLEEEMNEKPASFCSLPPEPSHETCPRTGDVLTVMREAEKLKEENAEADEVVVVYLSGNPGCSKSQVARQVAETFYEKNKEKGDVFVMTLDAKNIDTVLESYIKFANLIGCTEYSVSKSTSKDLNKEEKLTFLKSLVISKVRCFSNWLIIVDNVTDIKSVSQYWPQPGTKELGAGLLLVTTQVSHSVPLNYSRSKHVFLSHGMKPDEAASLLSKIANVPSDNCSKAEELAEKLDYQPLALACAAVYVKETGVSWEQYLMKLEEGKRKATEEVYESTSQTYRTTMTTAVLLAIQREVEKHDILKHALQFISFLAPEKIALDYVTKYLLVRLPDADEEAVKSKILRSSLILVLNTTVKEIKVHQIVHNTLKLNLSLATCADDDCVTASVLSFGSLVSCNINELNIIVAAQTLVTHFRHLFHAVKRIRPASDFLSKDSKMIGDCISVMGELCDIHGEFEHAKNYHQQALDIRKGVYRSDHPDVATSLNSLGKVYSNLGQYEKAKDFHQRALLIHQVVYSSDHPDAATSLSNLGNVCNNLGQYEQAKDFYQRALVIREAVYGSDHPHVAMSLNNLGAVYSKLGQYEQAKDFHQRAMVIGQAVFGNDHPHTARSLNNLGAVYRKLGQYEQAKDFDQRALVIRQAVYDSDHPHVATSLSNLGTVYRKLGQYEQAKDFYQRALFIRHAVFGNDHPDVARSLNNLGTVYRKLGQYKQAEDFDQRALVICQAVYTTYHPQVAKSLNNLGTVYRKFRQYEQAKDFYQWSLVIRQAVYASDHPHVATSLNNLGIVCHDLGQYEQAKDFFQRSLVIGQAVYGSDHTDVAISLNNLGNVCDDLGQYEQAKVFYRRALVIRQNVDEQRKRKIQTTPSRNSAGRTLPTRDCLCLLL